MEPMPNPSKRKDLETKSTQELRQALQRESSAEEQEAIRRLLEERQAKSTRAACALASAVVFGVLGATAAWWQTGPGVLMVLAGVGGAGLGFASWYVPDLIPRA